MLDCYMCFNLNEPATLHENKVHFQSKGEMEVHGWLPVSCLFSFLICFIALVREEKQKQMVGIGWVFTRVLLIENAFSNKHNVKSTRVVLTEKYVISSSRRPQGQKWMSTQDSCKNTSKSLSGGFRSSSFWPLSWASLHASTTKTNFNCHGGVCC